MTHKINHHTPDCSQKGHPQDASPALGTLSLQPFRADPNAHPISGPEGTLSAGRRGWPLPGAASPCSRRCEPCNHRSPSVPSDGDLFQLSEWSSPLHHHPTGWEGCGRCPSSPTTLSEKALHLSHPCGALAVERRWKVRVTRYCFSPLVLRVTRLPLWSPAPPVTRRHNGALANVSSLTHVLIEVLK